MLPTKITPDYAIVGQGLAGTLLAHFLRRVGKTVRVYDGGHHGASSTVAAGVMNPITGWRFVKSWQIDTLLPFALRTYRELEQQLGARFLWETDIIRSIHAQKDLNNWLTRSLLPDYAPYMQDEVRWERYAGRIHPPYAAGTVRGGGRLHCRVFLETYREFLRRHDLLVERELDAEQLTELTRTQRVVLCRGYREKLRPEFAGLPFGGSKGEVLLVRIPGAGFERIFKNRVFLVRLEGDLYWVGSAYANQFDDEQPSEAGRAQLLAKLDAALAVPYEVVDHRAAVRPTTIDRRPFLGAHPTRPNLFIFNGLGTKGASLAPYFAARLVDFLEAAAELPPEVDIRRFAMSENAR